MNSKTKASLNFLSVIISIAEVVFCLITVILFFTGIVVAIPSFRNQVNMSATIAGQTIKINESMPNIPLIIGAIVLVLIIIGLLFFITKSLKQIINSMKNNRFFTKDNLHNLKRILQGVWFIIAIQFLAVITSIFLMVLNNKIFSVDLTSLVISFVFLAIFHTIYTLMKNGIALKDENDSFI